MLLRSSFAAVAVAAGLLSVAAHAQTMIATPNDQARALGRCFVLKTTGADRLVVARWLGGAIGSGDAVTSLMKVDAARKAEADQAMAALFTRLFTQDCADEARPLVKAADQKGLEAAGGMLGEIAMRELLSDAKVSTALFDYLKYIDTAAFAKLQQ